MIVKRTLNQTLNNLYNDVYDYLHENRTDIEQCGYRICDNTTIGKTMFDDWLEDKIRLYYKPLSFEEIYSWTKEEFSLISTAHPRCEEGNSILQMMIYAAEDYLRYSIYRQIPFMLEEMKRKAA